MKIKTLHIDHYGKFKNHRVDLPDDPFILVYGPNETGKSTAMSFIKNMIFGFPVPKKLQPFCKPGQEALLGGKLTLTTPRYGEVTVTRNYLTREHPIALSTTVLQRDQELIKDLIKGIDLRLFEAIFCFDLNGLQGLEHVKDDELNHYLFSTGMMGSARIHQLEKYLDKQQGELFKPSGKNPKMNQSLDQLDKYYQEGKDWIKKNHDYSRLSDRLYETENSLGAIQEKIKENAEKQEKYRIYHTLSPLLKEQRMIELKLKALVQSTQFPEDGVIRLENWQQQLIDYEAELDELTRSIQHLESELESIHINETLLQGSKEVEGFVKAEPYITRLKNDQKLLKESLQLIRFQIEEHMSDLGEGWTETSIKQVDTGLSSKQSLKELHFSLTAVHQEKQALEQELSHTHKRVQNYKDKIEKEKGYVLDEQKRQQYIAILEREASQASLQMKLESLMSIQKENKEQQKRTKKTANRLGYIGASLGGFLLATLLLSHQMLLGFSLGFSLIFVSLIGRVFLIKSLSSKRNHLDEEVNRVKDEIKALEGIELSEIKQHLKRDEEAAMLIAMTEAQLEEEQMNYRNMNQTLNQLERKELELEKQFEEWFERTGLQGVSRQIATETLEVIEKVKQLIREKERLLQKIGDNEEEIHQHKLAYQSCLEKLLIEPTTTTADIEQMIKEETNKSNIKEHIVTQLNDKIVQEQTLRRKRDHVNEQIQHLFDQANADDEDTYRLRAKDKEEHDLLTSRLANIGEQIQMIVANRGDLMDFQAMMNQGLNDVSLDDLINEREELKTEEKRLRQQIADDKSEMKQIEESASYSNLLHVMEHERAAFNQMAKKWAVYRTAAELLRLAKEQYRLERLPKLLDVAKHYFNKITNGKYTDIYLTDEDGFFVKSKEGAPLRVIELSRGAAEQLYLSIRLSLAAMYDSPTRFPLIIDDSFVNFDEGRLKAVIELLQDIAKERQILLFTCHEEPYKQLEGFTRLSLA